MIKRTLAAVGAFVGTIIGKQFVEEKTCVARQGCIEGAVRGLEECVKAEVGGLDNRLDNVEVLINTLISKVDGNS
jgi:hypothetical protein